MAEKSRELVKKAGIIPRLDLAPKNEKGVATPNGPHKVKLLEEKIVKGTDYQTGEEREEMKWIFEEKGKNCFYTVPVKNKNGELHYLIQRMAEVELLDEVILEAKKKGMKTYIDVQEVDEKEDSDEEIPVIEDE